VVVVDGSTAAISHYQASVRGLSVELRAFRTADEAIGYLHQHHPALVFLDIVMPDKDGLTLLKELRSLPGHRDTAVIVVTSKDYAQDRSVARELGAAEFLLKPLRSREVRTLIARYTDGSTAGADDTGPR
jgi:CheY-like chemotaxis protein